MQNLPTNSLLSMFDSYVQAGPVDRPDFGSWNEEFKNIFRDVVDSGRNESSGWEIKQPRDNSRHEVNNHASNDQPVRDVNRHTQTGTRLDDPMTREEFAAVREVLDKNGYPPEKISRLEKRFESEGLTWKELKSELAMSDEFGVFMALILSTLDRLSPDNLKQGMSKEELAALNKFIQENGLDVLKQSMSKEDFEAVKKLLLEHGLSADQIKNLEAAFEKDGLTWQELIARLNLEGLSPEIKLDAGDKTELLSFFASLGFSSNESQEMIRQLQQGRHSEVWAKISEKLENMPADHKLAISREQAGSLLKVLGIDPQKMEKIAQFLGRDLGKTELNNFLAMLKTEARGAMAESIINHIAQAKGEGGKVVDPLLAQVLRLAGKEEVKSAPNERAREMANLKAKLENTPRGIVSSGEEHKSAQTKFDDAKSGNFNEKQNTGEDRGKKSLFDILQDKAAQRAEGKTDEAAQTREKQDPWEKFLSRIITLDSSDSRSAALGEVRTTHGSEAARSRANVQQRAFVARQVMEQVQSGLLKNLNNGRTQLTLQLDPPNLGRVAVILQIQDKEVRALIRPSSPEVAQMVSDNLARLKASLEQQGLRVAKIEVQTQTQEGQTQTWQGQEEHNKARERMREAIRIARMRGLDKTGKTDHEEMPAAEIHLESRDGPGLDIFA